MKKLLFINGCVREQNSRTLKLANSFLNYFLECHPEYELEQVVLNNLGLKPLDCEMLEQRDKAIVAHSTDEFELACNFKSADILVIAAPFWEGTFPAAVHTYIEHICVSELTFSLSENGYTGLCKAEKAVFITTRGGIYEEGPAMCDNHASNFLKSVLGMLGIGEVITVAAEGLDIFGVDVESKLQEAKQKLLSLARKL